MIRMLLFNLVFLAAVGLALARGGIPERATATIFCVARVATFFALHSYGIRFHSVEIGVFEIDVGVFVALLVVAIAADRFWPMPVVAMQGVSILAHVAELYGRDLMPVVYMNAVQLWAYPELVLLLIGTMRVEFRNWGLSTVWGRVGRWPADLLRSRVERVRTAPEP